MKKLIAIAIVSLAAAVGNASSADGELHCYAAGPIYVWGSGTLPCELGAPVVTCQRCVTSIEVKAPLNQVP